MLQRFTLFFILLLSHAASANSNAPEYFTKEIDTEYRALLTHVRKLLPETDVPLVYLPAFTPFNLLDVRPTKLKDNKNQQDFANFNFGVFGASLLNVDRQQLSYLPGTSICKKHQCKADRIDNINAFLMAAADELKALNKNKKLLIVQQTDADVYRVNNTFFSPTTLITYFPSEHAGFVPSGQFKMIATVEDEPELKTLAHDTIALRAIMAKHQVAAIAKVDDISTNIIFGGLGDNHWGVVIEHHANLPATGDYSHIGLEYDIIEALSETRFYYQTN